MPSPDQFLAQMKERLDGIAAMQQVAIKTTKERHDQLRIARDTRNGPVADTTPLPSESTIPQSEFRRLLSQLPVGTPGGSPPSASTSSSRQSSAILSDRPLCAYANTAEKEECLNAAVSVCSRCRLVMYCSESCQRKHWKQHATDCKDPMRSKDWKPDWVRQGRQAKFWDKIPVLHAFSGEIPLWGTMPATDFLNLSAPEAASQDAIDVALIASKDLRDVVRTVNKLPKEFKGKLTILMNDSERFAVLRNVLILQLLGTHPDRREAGDIALHLWYSVFIPAQYDQYLAAVVAHITTDKGPVEVKLGAKSLLQAEVDGEVRSLCAELAKKPVFDAESALRELQRVRFHKPRVDMYDRHNARLEPSHRLATHENRRFGILAPFGAHKSNFNTPNRLLFSPIGDWLQDDLSNPILCWDTVEVVQSGKDHGCTREDIYGCLYFHLVDELLAFAERLSTFEITFKLTQCDPIALANRIRRNDAPFGLTSTTRFDRIDLGDTLDHKGLGVASMLDAWGGLLKRDKNATMLGCFVKWAMERDDSQPSVEECVSGSINAKLDRLGRSPDYPRMTSPAGTKEWMDELSNFRAPFRFTFCSVYDTSKSFNNYLAQQGLDTTLKRLKLKRKQKHSVVPHRLHVPVEAGPTALPEFKDRETWLIQSNIRAPSFQERYVEITWA